MTVPSSRPNRVCSEGLAGTTVVRSTPLPESTLILILVTPDIQQDTGHGVVAMEKQWEIGVKGPVFDSIWNNQSKNWTWRIRLLLKANRQ